MIEKWDAYDENFTRVANVELIRGEHIPQGLFHLVCDVIVKHQDGTYLLMRRDLKKKHGGMWEASAGGSALKGEEPLDCAKRELWEETGIVAENITEIGREIRADCASIYVEFLCVVDGDKHSIRFQEGETIDYRWVTLEEFQKMSAEELLTTRIQKFMPEFCKK